MLRKIPIVACPFKNTAILKGLFAFRNKEVHNILSRQLKDWLTMPSLFLTNSATAAFYLALEALKQHSGKNEVVIPAYTALSLVNAIKKARLRPVLCDISLDSFNMDPGELTKAVSPSTLAILGVHMFGLVFSALESIQKQYPDSALIEDCAQSMGSRINGRLTGTVADISFFSFNRGKNIPTYGGGFIATKSAKLAEAIGGLYKTFIKQTDSFTHAAALSAKLFALWICMHPWMYGMLHPLVMRFKEKAPRKDFSVDRYTALQASVACSLFEKIDDLSKKRYDNGMLLYNGLKDVSGVRCAHIGQETEPSFNRFPIIVQDIKRKALLKEKLSKIGIETSDMYYRPLHHQYDLGYRREDFPNAVYFGEHLLTMPAHPLMGRDDLERTINIIRENR